MAPWTFGVSQSIAINVILIISLHTLRDHGSRSTAYGHMQAKFLSNYSFVVVIVLWFWFSAAENDELTFEESEFTVVITAEDVFKPLAQGEAKATSTAAKANSDFTFKVFASLVVAAAYLVM